MIRYFDVVEADLATTLEHAYLLPGRVISIALAPPEPSLWRIFLETSLDAEVFTFAVARVAEMAKGNQT